jgi:hypothetical protein
LIFIMLSENLVVFFIIVSGLIEGF